MARAGLCSRRDAEDWIAAGRVAVNGKPIASPAVNVTARDRITIDGKPMPQRERTRLFLYNKPVGLVTTNADPQGRPTVFDALPAGLPAAHERRPPRHRHRGAAAADERRRPRPGAGAARHPVAAALPRARPWPHQPARARPPARRHLRRRRELRADRGDARARAGHQYVARLRHPRGQEPRGPQRARPPRPAGEPADPRRVRAVRARRSARRRDHRDRDAGAARSARRGDRAHRPTAISRAPSSRGAPRARATSGARSATSSAA